MGLAFQLLPHVATEDLVYLVMASLLMSKRPFLHESFDANVD